MAGFAVEAWFRDTRADTITDRIRQGLTQAGFTLMGELDSSQGSWNLVELCRHPVFVNIQPLRNKYTSVFIQSEISWEKGYYAFEKYFEYLLGCRYSMKIEELFLATRNPQPYSVFLFREYSPTVLIEADQELITHITDRNYWTKVGPAIHFIANGAFKQAQVDPYRFASSIGAGVIDVPEGVLLDCGWTNEFEFPSFIVNNGTFV